MDLHNSFCNWTYFLTVSIHHEYLVAYSSSKCALDYRISSCVCLSCVLYIVDTHTARIRYRCAILWKRPQKQNLSFTLYDRYSSFLAWFLVCYDIFCDIIKLKKQWYANSNRALYFGVIYLRHSRLFMYLIRIYIKLLTNGQVCGIIFW